MRKVRKYVHLQFGFAKFDTVICERNLEELVLSNEDNMVVPGWVEFVCGVRRFGRVTRGMEATRKMRVKLTAGIRMTSTYSHLQEDIARGAPRIFSGSRDPLNSALTRRS